MEADIEIIAQHLVAILGAPTVARLACVGTPATATNWALGVFKPRRKSENRLRDAYEVLNILLLSNTPSEEIAPWFTTESRACDAQSPANAIRVGRGHLALRAAEEWVSY